MNRNTYYIEYLIVGSIAVALYLQGIGLNAVTPENESDSFILIWTLMIIPAAYVCGILVDGIGVIFFELPLRHYTNDSNLLRRRADSRTAEIIAFDDNLYSNLRTLRSRDRIVRGSAVALLATCLFDIAPSDSLMRPIPSFSIDLDKDWLLWMATLLLFGTWGFLHYQTRKFKAAAYELAMRKKG